MAKPIGPGGGVAVAVAATATGLPPGPSAVPRGPAWILGRTSDLAFLVGGVLVAWALLAAHLFLGVAAVTIYVVWILAVDGPHVFATLSRTYLDRGERAARAPLLRGSLGFFALGPASVALAILLGRRTPYDVFLAFCSVWAYWHVVRQHYGVMMLYKRKAGDTAPLDDRIDRAFLHVALIAPVVGFALHHRRALGMLGLAAPPAWAEAATTAAWATFATALAALVVRQAQRVRGGLPVNWTKLLFVATATSLSVVLFSPPVAARIEYEAVFPIVTSFHNVQYLAIVWFFHENRRTSGARPLVARHLWAFLGAGVVFTLAYRVGLGCLFSAWPGCDAGLETVRLPAGLVASDVGIGFLWGFALHHYYLDQRIWHVSRDAALRHDLRLDAAPSRPRHAAAPLYARRRGR
jgi:hypothetical protein